MTRWLVMPRGINVGARNRVPMAELRRALEAADCDDVVTLGQSGNIILSSNGDEGHVTALAAGVLSTQFGVDVPVLARDEAELRAVYETNPLANVATDGSKYLAIFLSQVPDTGAMATLLQEGHAPEVVAADGRTVFVWTPEGVKAMTVSHTALERRFGLTATARNWNTLEQIIAKL